MRLTTKEYLLTKINVSHAELAAIPALIQEGRTGEAEHVYAEFVRARLQPEKYFRIPYYGPENVWKLPSETEADVYRRLLHNEVVSCGYAYDFGEAGVQWEANPTPNQYREWTWQLNRHHEFRALGHLYRETGDEDIAALFVRLFTSWREQCVCPDEAPGYETLSWRTIEIGIREAKNWHYALHAFYRSPAFTDHALCEFFASMWENGWRLRNFHHQNNWLIMEMTGLFHIGLLYPWVKDAAEWKAYAMSTLLDEMETQLYPDRFQVELSTNYHGVLAGNGTAVIDICRAMEEPLPDSFLEKMSHVYDLYPKLADPGFFVPDINDGNHLDVANALVGATKLFPERQDYRYFVSRRAEGAPPDFTDVVMPYSGMVILRDSWAADSQWAFFESAPFGRGHQHEDKLNFLLYAYGRDLLRDTGNFAYDSSDMRKYVLSSRAHNTVLVDGMGQNRRSRYHWEAEDRTKPADLSVKLGAERDVARGIYAEGYGPDNLDVRHERTVVKVKRNPLGLKTFYLVIDRLTAADGLPHVYDAHWQLEDVPVLTGGASGSPYSHHERGNYLAELLHGSRVTADYGDGVTLTLLSGENCTLRRGSRKPFVGWRTPNRPATAVDFTAVAPSARIVTLLYPSDEGCPIETVTYDSSVEDKEITIRTANGEWLFSE